MRFLLICIMLHCISFSQIPLIQLTKQRQTEHSKSVSASETLWDNQVRYLGSGITSAQLNGLPQFQRSIEVVDDFTIPSGFNWSIDSIFAIGTPAGGNPDRFRVIIYSDNTGDVGPVIYAEEFEATTSVIIRHRLQTPLNLSSGDYWFSIVAVFDDADDFTVKNWFWDTSPDERRFEARVRDFTGQSGFNIWTPFSQAGVADHSVSFALYGTDLTPPFFKDSITLVELYSQLDGPNWLNQSGWQSADSLGQWFGVKTENGRLVELDLSDNNLSGTINLRLDFLSVLKKLNLSGNNLTGVLDGDRFMLDSLTHLDLSANQFSGQIPDDFFSLPKLEYLNLSKNQFNGFLDYLGDSSSTLNYLNLADNQLSYIPVLDFHIDSLILNNNRFVFNSIEINLDHSTYMNYADQDSLGEEIDTIVQKGGGFSVLIQDNAESNIYTWYLNDIEISSSISNFFQADNLDFNDSGTYRYEITNTVADQLVIHSRPIHIEIKDLNTTLFLFQSPGFSQKFKAVLRSDTPLENVPLIKLNNFVLSTINTDNTMQLFSSSFTVGENGLYNLTSSSRASGNLLDQASKQFTITIVPIDSTAKLQSPDGNLKVSFPANAVNQQTAFMLEMNADKHFFLGPEIDLNKAAEISINTDGNRSLRLYRKSDQSDELISDQQFIDNQLLVKINRTGTFLLKEQQTSTHSVDRFKLYPNYPNPFNPITTIRYDLDKETQVELDVLNILGQRVKQLVYKRQKANSYQLIWDGRNESGEQLASGVYFYRLKTENQLQIRKMILIK